MVAVLPLVGLILCVVALVLDVGLSFAPMYWYYKSDTVSGVTTERWGGLWRYCQKISSSSSTTEDCENHYDDNYTYDKSKLTYMYQKY